MATQQITLKFNKEKETKNTVRYQADGHEDILYVYIMKDAVAKLDNPDSISMVLKAVK